MKGNPDDRAIELAEYILQTGSTVRSCAGIFGVSKSTVHKDITARLKRLNHSMYLQVQQVLLHNKSERHIRGGLATKEKYRCSKK